MKSVDEWMHQAMQLHHSGQLEQAEKLLNHLLEHHPMQADALHLLGVIAFQVNKIGLGIQLIEQAIQSNPHVGIFYSNLGEMHRQINDIEKSIQYGRKAIELSPHSAIALSNLGIAYYDAKQFEAAEDCHKQALALNPKLLSSLNNMGSIYKAKSKLQEATHFYQSAIRISPLFVDPLNNLGALLLEQQAFKQALNYLSQAVKLLPTFADAHCNMGLALLGLEQWDKALDHLEKALHIKPDYAEAYYGLAKVHLHQYQFLDAEYAIRKAITINPQKVELYQLLAEIYHEQGDYKKSLFYLDHAIDIDSTHPHSYLNKGTLLMEMGEKIKAEEHFLKSADTPNIDNQILAHYALVQLHKVKAGNVSLKHLLSILHQSTQTPFPNKLEYAYFALGKCHDDMGEWAKAFEYFSLGCQIKRTRFTYSIDEQIEFTHKLIHSFTPQTIEYLQSFASPSALPIFIVGMPRSGTTLVEHILSSHSRVDGAGELNYLNHLIQQPIKHHQTSLYYPENVQQFSSETCHAIANHYLSYLQRFSPDAVHITDKMPHNFIAIGLIHALFPKAKIIHVKRNPMDTCWSCYTKLFTKGHLYSYDLAELGQYYQCYERIMNHWRCVLPSDAWLDVKYETMVHHVDEEAKRIIDYCHLPWEQDCLRFYESKRHVRTASFIQVRQPVYTSSVGRWRRYENELSPLLRPLASNQSPSNTNDQKQG